MRRKQKKELETIAARIYALRGFNYNAAMCRQLREQAMQGLTKQERTYVDMKVNEMCGFDQ